MKIEGTCDIQEIQISGDLACCWNNLRVSITPPGSRETKHRAGPVLTIFRREADGKWRLFRDANMLTAV